VCCGLACVRVNVNLHLYDERTLPIVYVSRGIHAINVKKNIGLSIHDPIINGRLALPLNLFQREQHYFDYTIIYYNIIVVNIQYKVSFSKLHIIFVLASFNTV